MRVVIPGHKHGVHAELTMIWHDTMCVASPTQTPQAALRSAFHPAHHSKANSDACRKQRSVELPRARPLLSSALISHVMQSSILSITADHLYCRPKPK